MNAKTDKKEITELYESVASQFANCDSYLMNVKTAIEGTSLIKKPAKKALLEKLKTIFAEANAIVDKIGSMGKVR